MLKLGRVTKVKKLFLWLVFVFNFDLFKFSAAILEKGLLIEIVKFLRNTMKIICLIENLINTEYRILYQIILV